MAAGLQCNVIGLTDALGVPAASVVSPNQRVLATLGTVATLADIVSFPGPSIVGNWVMPTTRCQISGIFAINASSIGIAYMPSVSGLSPTGPMSIKLPDTRASGM